MSIQEAADRRHRADNRVPPLSNGDRLAVPEFMRRYGSMPQNVRAELVEGVVYMLQPLSAEGHGEPHFDLITWLGVYRAGTPGVIGGDNATLMLDLDNAPQPDGYLRLLPEHGGQSKVVDGYVVGAPELVVEVAASSTSYDLGDKLNAYRRNQVQEYIVWRTWDRAIDWFSLREGEFIPLPADQNGIHRSQIFPGLWLDSVAVISGSLGNVLDVLAQGVASPEHRAYVNRLSTGQ